MLEVNSDLLRPKKKLEADKDDDLNTLYNLCYGVLPKFWITTTQEVDNKSTRIWGLVHISIGLHVSIDFRPGDGIFPIHLDAGYSAGYFMPLIKRLSEIVRCILGDHEKYAEYIKANLPVYMKEGYIETRDLIKYYPAEDVSYTPLQKMQILEGMKYSTIYPEMTLDIYSEMYSKVFKITLNSTEERGRDEFERNFPRDQYSYNSQKDFIGILNTAGHAQDIIYSKLSLIPDYNLFTCGWTFRLLSRHIDRFHVLKKYFNISLELPNIILYDIQLEESQLRNILEKTDTRIITPWIFYGDHLISKSGISMGFPDEPSKGFLSKVMWSDGI